MEERRDEWKAHNMFSAEWWELYTGMDGVKEAAYSITKHLMYHAKLACNYMGERPYFTSQDAGLMVFQSMMDVMTNYDTFGACDSEPRWVLAHWINNKFNCEVS